VLPLMVLSFFAIFCATGGEDGPLARMLFASEPQHVAGGLSIGDPVPVSLPGHHDIHEVHSTAGWAALFAAVTGGLLSYLFYGAGVVNPAAIKSQLAGIHGFLMEKWQFDNLYEVMWLRPTNVVANWAQGFDKSYIDAALHKASQWTIDVSKWDRKFDEGVVDRLVNVVGEVTFASGRELKRLQTGRIRQYVMFIAFGVLGLFLAAFAFLPR
jgi:NADH:ubiquinone oxidoreductase subunit 5 (subunit L)/multisubunit Na+/H+ antiporter MnhA subunit